MDATTETAIVERTISIDASPETVWEFFVDPEKLKRWKGIDAKLEPRPGGVYWCEVIPGHVAAGAYADLAGADVVVIAAGSWFNSMGK